MKNEDAAAYVETEEEREEGREEQRREKHKNKWRKEIGWWKFQYISISNNQVCFIQKSIPKLQSIKMKLYLIWTY